MFEIEIDGIQKQKEFGVIYLTLPHLAKYICEI